MVLDDCCHVQLGAQLTAFEAFCQHLIKYMAVQAPVCGCVCVCVQPQRMSKQAHIQMNVSQGTSIKNGDLGGTIYNERSNQLNYVDCYKCMSLATNILNA